MSDEWKNRIVTMIYIKQELVKLDVNKIWPHYFPEVAADEEEIKRAEVNLNYEIDQQYAEFLRTANGWKGFLQTVDLFGTKELSNPNIMKYVFSLFDSIEDCVIESSGFTRDELIPFAATRFDKDIFVIARQTSHKPGTILWFAGEEIDRYPSFEEFFLAMLDYNRMLLQNMQKSIEETYKK
jgi:hypothetical protein